MIYFLPSCIVYSYVHSAIQYTQEGDEWRQLVAYQLLISSKNDIGNCNIVTTVKVTNIVTTIKETVTL